MNNIVKHNENIASFVTNIILKYCPYVENRLSILGNTQSQQLDIEMRINNNQSHIIFLLGNEYFKREIPDQALIESVIEFEEIENIIDFILNDHEVIKYATFDENELNFKFAINWTDESIKGINCNDIGLSLIFNNPELKNQYLYLICQKYYNHLERVPSFKEMRDKYINNIKKSYFNTLDKAQLLSLLNEMNENELQKLLYNLDNDIFMKYVMDDENKQKSKNYC